MKNSFKTSGLGISASYRHVLIIGGDGVGWGWGCRVRCGKDVDSC